MAAMRWNANRECVAGFDIECVWLAVDHIRIGTFQVHIHLGFVTQFLNDHYFAFNFGIAMLCFDQMFRTNAE
ncbi:Uncharacterised protein [Vibrio cholerae]|nr:Uncharacterised protein [Vibrio cholerae]